jgi:transketolase
MDAVQRVGNGHPGTAVALAPAAYLLFQRHLRHDPSDPAWLGRDRFILSCGHASLTLYVQLVLSGYPLDVSDLESFRTWGSLTPGHPEYGHTAGVEVTTGPLGQGVATGVGMAMAARYQRTLLDPDAEPGTSPFDHRVWVLASDGDLQEGISGEASSLAGTQHLDGLVVIWDDNRISIEGDTALSFSEDVCARYRAYGWAVHEVERQPSGDIDLVALDAAMTAATHERQRPTFIRLRTTIAWPAPTARGTEAAHGSALGAGEVAATKVLLGLDPEDHFALPAEVLAHTREVHTRGGVLRAQWERECAEWAVRRPDGARVLARLRERGLPDDLTATLPVFAPGSAIATRVASGQVLNALAQHLPELWGGSADLGGSNNTSIAHGLSFLPPGSDVPDSSPGGRVVHFGVREHAMGAILNGMALEGLTRPFGGTFLVFSDYMRGSVRLASLMRLPVIYVWTHDSIGVGEDGPTHQPVEMLWSLRAIPGLSVVRPADATETAVAWVEALRRGTPVGLVLTRQNLPVLDRALLAPAAQVARGGYILSEPAGTPDAIIIATGSEVTLALDAQRILADDGLRVRVVSMPCVEWFEEESADYRQSVLPDDVRARVAVEAGVSQGWWKYLGTHGRCVSLEHFGASASGPELFRRFGITADAVADAVRESHALRR